MSLATLPALVLIAVLSGAAFLVLWLDRYKAQPIPRLVLVACWGAACPLIFRLADQHLGLAGYLDPLTGAAAVLPIAAGLVEELVIAVGLTVLATSHYLDGPVDGAVYGTVAGLGSAACQIISAFHGGVPPPHAGVPVLITLVRAAAAAGAGASIGFAKLAVRPIWRVPCALGAVLVAGLGRWLLYRVAGWGWETWGVRNTAFNLALEVVAAMLLIGLFEAAWAFECRVLRHQLAEEVELGVLPTWVNDVLPRYRRRIRADWWSRRDERREIVHLLTSLAYRKHQLRGLSEERARLYGLEVGRLRQRARTLLALASDGDPTPGADE